MDFYSDEGWKRLARSVERSYRDLDTFRIKARSLVEDYAGSLYGKGAKYETVLNLMNQALRAIVMSSAANRPQVLVTPPDQTNAFFGKKLELAVNALLEEIELGKTLKRWLVDAFFCIGIVKVHRADSQLVDLGNETYADPGRPYASNVWISNFVVDTEAKNWSQVRYAGDMYRMPLSELETIVDDPAVLERLKPTPSIGTDMNDRVDTLSRGEESRTDDLEDMVDLLDLWVARDRKVYTFVVTDRGTLKISGPPIAEFDDPWERGPYHILGLGIIPENLMPDAPAPHLMSLSRTINNIMRKQSKRSRSQKRVHAFSASAQNEARAIRDAGDDDYVHVEDPKNIGTLVVGGPDPDAQNFLLSCVNFFDRMAGNLPAALGLGASAETFGQEQLIQASVSKQIGEIQTIVVEQTTELIRHLAFMLWNDEYKTIPLRLPIEGAPGYDVAADWTPDDREREFDEYRLQIDVYSMPYQSPQDRINKMNAMLAQIYLPMMQMVMQQGGTIDIQKLAEVHADLMHEPRFKEIVKFTGVPQQEMDAEEGSAKPMATTRNYVRRNVSGGGTPQSRNIQEQQVWAASKSQRGDVNV